MLQEFITLDTLQNFSMLIVILVILTEFTKKLWDKFSNLKTELVVFIYAIILINLDTLSANGFKGDYKEIIVTITLNFVNALLISYITSASYSKIISNYKSTIEDNTKILYKYKDKKEE